MTEDKKEQTGEKKIAINTTGRINWNEDEFGTRLTFKNPKFDIYLPKRLEKMICKGKKFRAIIEEI